jgi:hypothetical protein
VVVNAALSTQAAALRPEPLTRRGILQIVWGPHSFRKIALTPGQQITFGRNERANVVVDDPKLSGQHFAIWFSGKRAIVRDLESAGGTFINGERSSRGEIGYGGFVVAGNTTFRLFLEDYTEPTEEPPSPERRALVAAAERAVGDPDGSLYAVLDAARAERVLWLLQESIDEHKNLYEGTEGRALDDVAPYLVRFQRGSSLLRRLLLGGWGDAWGVFFRSNEHPKEVRRQLRRFLMVLDDAKSERMYFRFYDPRVMREFYQVATNRQRAELLHGMSRMVLEAEDGSPLVLEPPPSPEEGAS